MNGQTFEGAISGQYVIPGAQALHGGTINFNIQNQSFSHGRAGPLAPSAHSGTIGPSFTVPFEADPKFVDRPDILSWLKDHTSASTNRGIRKAATKFKLTDIFRPSEISKRLSQPGAHCRRCALVGLGGVGKSQIVIQHAHKVRAKSPKTSVFWVHGGSKERFMAGYREIAERAQLFTGNNSQEDMLHLVCGWLNNDANGPWLMIVDNADDEQVFFGAEGGLAMAQFLPRTGSGSIIFTSRSMDTAEKLVGVDSIYKVSTMLPNQAIELFRNGLGQLPWNEEGACWELVHQLGLIPLAVTQAAAYIRRMNGRVSVSSYLQYIRMNDGRAKMLLEDVVDRRRDNSASNSLVSTWQITFDQVDKERPSASDLLTFMSFFNPQAIPEFALREYSRRWGSGGDFEKDLDVLCGYSLVNVVVPGEMLGMHPLVRFCMRISKKYVESKVQWIKAFLWLIADIYPYGMYENWHICQLLEPHITGLFNYKPEDPEDALKRAVLLANAGHYRLSTGKSQEAEHLLQQAVEANEVFLGKNHLETRRIQVELLMIRLENGAPNTEEAELAIRDMLGSELRDLGSEHPETLDTAYRLGCILGTKGAYQDAERTLREVLAASTRVLGASNVMTIDIAHSLGMACMKLGSTPEAEQILRSAMGTALQSLGATHPTTLDITQTLGQVIVIQGRYAEAEMAIRTVLERKMGVFGPDNLSTLETLGLLASVLGAKGDALQSERIAGQVYSSIQRQLGFEHPRTLEAAYVLGLAWSSQGRHQEAEQVMRHVLDGVERVLGAETGAAHSAALELAMVLLYQLRISEAAVHFQRAEQGMVKILGPGHPDVQIIRERYWSLLYQITGQGVPRMS